jgi:hypothetical protein
VAGQVPVKGVQPKTAVAKRAPAKKTPSKAVAKVTKPEDKSDFTPAQAQKLTERIRKNTEGVFEDVKKAYLGRIWIALGHKTWDEYLDKNYEGIALPLPREKKREALQSLAAAGFSSRAAAAATGVGHATAARHGKVTDPAPVSNETPDVIDVPPHDITELSDGASEFTPEGTSQPEEQRRQGADGKSYPASQSPREPVLVNIVSLARTLAKDLDNLRIRLDHLFARDDYSENKVDVQGTLETAVGDFIDTIVEEFADLVRERAPEEEPELAV